MMRPFGEPAETLSTAALDPTGRVVLEPDEQVLAVTRAPAQVCAHCTSRATEITVTTHRVVLVDPSDRPLTRPCPWLMLAGRPGAGAPAVTGPQALVANIRHEWLSTLELVRRRRWSATRELRLTIEGTAKPVVVAWSSEDRAMASDTASLLAGAIATRWLTSSAARLFLEPGETARLAAYQEQIGIGQPDDLGSWRFPEIARSYYGLSLPPG